MSTARPAGPVKAECIVVGGGFAGVMSALELAHAGVDVLLIDHGDFGTGASGVNAGNIHQQLMLYYFYLHGPEWYRNWAGICRLYRQSWHHWRHLDQRLAGAARFDNCGGITVAQTQAQVEVIEFKSELENANGIETEVLGQNALQQAAPYLDPSARAGCYCRDEAKIDVLAAFPAVFGLLCSNPNVRTLRNCAITSVSADASEVRLDTSMGALRADKLVIAAGFGTVELARQLGVDLPVEMNPIQMLVTDPAGKFLPHLLYHAERRMTLKQVANGNVVMGGGTPAKEGRPGQPDELRWEGIVGALRTVIDVVPAVANLQLLRGWTGRVFSPTDGYPLVDALPGYGNVVVAVSNQFGVTLSPVVGKTAAALVMGAGRRPDEGMLALGRETLSASTRPVDDSAQAAEP